MRSADTSSATDVKISLDLHRSRTRKVEQDPGMKGWYVWTDVRNMLVFIQHPICVTRDQFYPSIPLWSFFLLSENEHNFFNISSISS